MTRGEIVTAARAWVGTPYRHQASLRSVGCDCLGLVRGVWRELFGAEPELAPPYAPDWAEAAGRETLMDAAERHFARCDAIRAGTLLVFRWKAGTPAKHVGIAVGPTRFVHAYDAAGRAVEGALVPAWRRRLAGTFDFPGVTD
ncbi:NlpC/P60 family protein [Acuticoccus sp. I52.16.1]|uniref:NlpC/P60 family protein n=1 Tax=Acuticoccus sp. I52.16.1 TaxID=2928472 RepID=UPI001FD28A0C|nr:NlpC/P60 family protein [Acuticoccus sp. I52.16.1]UOM33837.1 NlpC/P60 family protein [Acuticoccus sp. I52.16.1]